MEYVKAKQEEVESIKKKGWVKLERELEGDSKGRRGLKVAVVWNHEETDVKETEGSEEQQAVVLEIMEFYRRDAKQGTRRTH